mmetsp:Transcript_26259/g.72114  ORF Transcript_26259/g.72114 Transcript_26259/m.72114 type:complete len:93 (-) Transcript_26259:664-942(-)
MNAAVHEVFDPPVLFRDQLVDVDVVVYDDDPGVDAEKDVVKVDGHGEVEEETLYGAGGGVPAGSRDAGSSLRYRGGAPHVVDSIQNGVYRKR